MRSPETSTTGGVEQRDRCRVVEVGVGEHDPRDPAVAIRQRANRCGMARIGRAGIDHEGPAGAATT